MMKKLLLTCCVFLLVLYTSAQQIRFKTTPYGKNILKVTAVPQRSNWHNENISDAVMSKSLLANSIHVFQNEGSIIVNNKVKIGLFDSAEFSGLTMDLLLTEKIFGGGERALPLNRRGYRLNLYNNPWYSYTEGADNLNYSVPFITSSNGYGLFFDNPSKGFLDIGKTNPNLLTYGAVSGEINVYIIFGDYQTILQSYHKLTGTQPLPPRWAMGNLMSRFGYTSEAQVKDIYNKMKAENIPVDAIIFDLFWFGDSVQKTMGNLDWVNKTKWPNPKKMIADFKKEGVQTILVTEPYFVETSKNYIASKPYLAVDSANKPFYLTDFYFGRGGLLDIFRKDAQSWFWQFYKRQMLNGVEAWWGDLGEPERHPSNMYHNLRDYGHKRLFAADEVHNLYGHTWTKMLNQFYTKEYPTKRLFSLNRAGFAGSQRYSIFPWTGDVSRSWSGLRAQLPVLLGMSMSGVPYVHSDAGGFAGGEGDAELYVRWLQFAAFTPIFRPHGTALYNVDPAAFSYPSEAALIDKEYRNMAKKAILTRYGLLPYNYSIAYQHTQKGKPLIAPLYYHFSTDTTAAGIEDQFMWGENIIVAPVVEKNAVVRKYYLPEGNWLSMYDMRLVSGRKWHTDSVSLENIPYFIKEGGFLPFRSIISTNTSTSKLADRPMEIIYNPSNDSSSFELFFDDGETNRSIEKKAFELIRLSSTGKTGRELTIALRSNNGAYKGKPSKRTFFFWIPSMENIQTITINKKALKHSKDLADIDSKNHYSNMLDQIVNFSVDFTGKPIEIKISW